ncbi:MAG: DUF1501 family [Verrucomicrobia bacterium]|nr:MAG: DUF1501 family [Verrucomicrobiota bacterium]
MFLSGGPPQHEMFDPKPEAPLEIRGTFRSIPTSVPGVHFSETLPYTARMAHRMAVIRSMTTEINSHSTSGYYMLTGYKHASKAENMPPDPSDWPSIAAVVGALNPGNRSPMGSVVLPEPVHNNPNILWPGQNGGLMGPTWHPHLLKCDPTQARLQIEGLTRPENVSEVRMNERTDLLEQLNAAFAKQVSCPGMVDFDRMQQKAFELLHSEKSREAFQIHTEPDALRDRYGRHKFGQSALLARRLVEAGVRLVQVNWPREEGDTNIGNPLWDTHSKNAERVRDVLCPQFDRTYATLLEDLHERGLLDETLVVVMGEFGRSPKINASGGRDHWGQVFSVALAGAGIGGGQIIGSSDRIGGTPESRPVRPPDLAATIFHLLGVEPGGEFVDPLGRPRMITDAGYALREIVGV